MSVITSMSFKCECLTCGEVWKTRALVSWDQEGIMKLSYPEELGLRKHRLNDEGQWVCNDS